MPTATETTTPGATEDPPVLPDHGDAVAHHLIAQARGAVQDGSTGEATAALDALHARIAAAPAKTTASSIDVSGPCEHDLSGLPAQVTGSIRNSGDPHHQIRLEVRTPGGCAALVVHADGTVATSVHDMTAQAAR